jgi:alcohol dehydrogenase, propanol-preferring
MRAARLRQGARQLVIEDVDAPSPVDDQVLVRVAGAGVCHSDLHVLDGMFDEQMRYPVTMGHEIAGHVEALGPRVRELEVGEAVVVMVGWGCGHCEWCVSGHEQICPTGDEAGATVDGGFAELVLVPHRRHVVPLGALDPLAATPFGCAALCSYAAVKRVSPHLPGGSALVVIGVGGLGQYGVQFARALSDAEVIAVDTNEGRLARARELGADHGLLAGPETAAAIADLTRGRGAAAVVDFVGTDETLALGAGVVARRGLVALLGLAGGTVPFGFFSAAPEASFTTVVAGTVLDLQEVVSIAQTRGLESSSTVYPLEAINDALDALRAGRVEGRAIVTPGGES